MRGRIVDSLNLYFGSDVFSYIIPDHAFIYAIMFGVGALIFIRRCAKDSLNLYHASGMLIWAAVAALIGTRLFYLIQNIEYTLSHPNVWLELNGPTVSFGVYIGSTLGIAGYSLFYRLSPWKYLDVLSSVLGLGPMIGRWACFLNGDDYGTLSNVPWAVQFPHGSYPFFDQVGRGLISPLDNLSLPVHPVQLYASLKGLILFAAFTMLWKKKLFKPGVLFLLFWMAYGVLRFFIEFFRGDYERGWIGYLSTGQFMSLVFCGMSLIALSVVYKWKLKKDEELLMVDS